MSRFLRSVRFKFISNVFNFYGLLCEDEGEGRHSLIVSSVSAVLDHGVWVIAQNHQGQDSCFIDVKTYRGPYGALRFLVLTCTLAIVRDASSVLSCVCLSVRPSVCLSAQKLNKFLDHK